MNYSPKKYKKLDCESMNKLLDTFDIEIDKCVISGVLNYFVEFGKYEVYVSLDNDEDIVDIFYKVFSSEKDAKKYFKEVFEKIKKTSNLQELFEEC